MTKAVCSGLGLKIEGLEDLGFRAKGLKDFGLPEFRLLVFRVFSGRFERV